MLEFEHICPVAVRYSLTSDSFLFPAWMGCHVNYAFGLLIQPRVQDVPFHGISLAGV